MVQHLPSNREALSTNSSNTKKQTNKQNKERQTDRKKGWSQDLNAGSLTIEPALVTI
jgi:hypothetical protein